MWLQVGLRVLQYIPAIVDIVERFWTSKGKAKQDAAVTMVNQLVEAAEGVAGRDLLNDPVVDTAARAVIDAVVAFQNILAEKGATK